MANKFINNLTQSSNEIRAERATFIAQDAKDAATTNLQNESKILRDLERERMKLSDMNRDSELSLQVTRDNFNAVEWVRQMQELGVKILNQKVRVQVAQGLNDEWFSEA